MVNFLIVGFALFLVVRAINALRRGDDEKPQGSTVTEKDVLVEIRDLLATQRDGSASGELEPADRVDPRPPR